MGGPCGILQVWHLGGPSVVAQLKNHKQLAVFSCCSPYMASCHKGDSTVIITNIHSQTSSQFINTDMEVEKLFLACNILLTLGSGVITAWHLTEEGVVDGVFGDRGAGQGDAIWTVPAPASPTVQVTDQFAIILNNEVGKPVQHADHIGTGEVLEPAQVDKLLSYPSHRIWEMRGILSYPHGHKLKKGVPPKADCPVSQDTLKKGQAVDSEGRLLLWIPTEWRVDPDYGDWCYKVRTLQLYPHGGMVTIVF